MTDAYRDDLAYIHDAGYTGLARHAAAVLLDALRRRGFEGGLVIDLGCGSGVLSQELSAAGYDVLGIDISPAMVALARQRVPAGRFRVASLLTADLPACVAVAAIGECFNYLFDAGNSESALAGLLRRVYDALTPGGLLLFDVAGPGRVVGSGVRHLHREGDDWAVLVSAEEDREQGLLTRRITTFRKVGELYRRDHEVHRQRLIAPAEMARQLRGVGFRVRRLGSYGPLPLPAGLAGFLARRP